MVLRVKRPEAHRPFKVPGGPVIPVLGIVSCLYLMLSLPVATWVRFLGWLNIGMLIYWFYGRVAQPAGRRARSRSADRPESLGNFVTVVGALLLFNGFFMALLGFMTDLRHDQRDADQMARDRRDGRAVGSSGPDHPRRSGSSPLIVGRLLARHRAPAT